MSVKLTTFFILFFLSNIWYKYRMGNKSTKQTKKKIQRAKKRRALLRQLIKEYHEIKPVRMIIMLVMTMALIVVSIFLFVSRPTAVEQLGDSYLETVEDVNALKKNIENDYTNTYSVKNYSIYGESLKFYHGTNLAKTDDLQGTNIALRNVETKDEISFTYGTGAEDGIKLGDLAPGLYEVYAYDHYIKKRIYFNSRIDSEVFETMRRNNRVKHIELVADKDFLKDYDVNLDKNYVFLSVTDNIPKVDTIDIMIDPCGTSSSSQSVSNDKYNEQQDSYQFALRVKKELESYGLKVKLTRDKDDTTSYYGKNGRVGKGYEQKAKVFLSVGYSQNQDADRPFIMTSPYSSAALANTISYTMQHDGLHMYETTFNTKSTLEEGVIYDYFMEDGSGTGKESKYEVWPQLRESGGKCTFTGQIEDALDNQRYSNSYGMYGIYFQFANVHSNDSMSYYKKYKKKMSKELAKGIARYFNIEEKQ